MIVVKPVPINDTTLISSNIPEPDIARGEVEWVDPTILSSAGGYDDDYRAMEFANDDHIYCVGNDGNVLKLDSSGLPSGTFGAYTGTYLTATAGNSGSFIYCVGDSGEVLKIDVVGQSVSTFGAYAGTYSAAARAVDGNIYCVGDSGTVLKIDVVGQSVSTFGVVSGVRLTATLANDGFIYCTGGVAPSHDVLKIDTLSSSVSTFGSYPGSYLAAVLANGNVYSIGNSGSVLEINIESQSATVFASYGFSGEENYRTLSIGDSGSLYSIGAGIITAGTSGKVLEVDLTSRTVSVFGTYLNDDFSFLYFASVLSIDGNIYCIGASSLSYPGIVAKINRLSRIGDRVVKTSTHSTYQATAVTVDDPEVGVLKDVPTWIFVSPTNKYKAFDQVVNTQSISDLTQVIEIKPGEIVGGIAAFNITGVISINVTMTDPTFGEVYNRDATLANNINIINWFNYLWTPIETKIEFVFLDLPAYLNATTKITFTGSGEIGVGAIVLGPAIVLGEADHGTSIQELDFSLYSEDSFGNLTITKRPVAKLVNFEVTAQKDRLPYVYSQLTTLSGVAAVWVGTTTDENDFTLVYGIKRDIRLNIDTPTVCSVPIQIRGLV